MARAPELRPYVGKQGSYPTTRFHWHVADDGHQTIIVCPACDCRPCPPECPEQLCYDTAGLWDPERAAARIAATGVDHGPGLVQAAQAEAAARRADEQRRREEVAS